VQGPKDFAAAFAAIAEERPDALLVLQDAVTMQQRNEIIDFAIQKRLRHGRIPPAANIAWAGYPNAATNICAGF
jgi:hypothetical protein